VEVGGGGGGGVGLALAALTCFSPDRRGLRTPGRSLGRLPNTPRSEARPAGLSGLSGSGVTGIYSTVLDGRVRHPSSAGTPSGARCCSRWGRRSLGGRRRRNRCTAPDSRSKWRKTEEFKRASGYHAAHRLSVPMLGWTPATGAHHSHRSAFLPQDRALGLPARKTRLGNSGRAPDKELGTETNPIHETR
jgi:hypothetical protein